MSDAATQLLLERFAKGDTPPPGMALKPGTVASNGFTDPTVVVDGDVTAVSVVSLVGLPAVGARVMVLFWPPHGLYVLGHLGVASGGGRPLGATQAGALVVATSNLVDIIREPGELGDFIFVVAAAPTAAAAEFDVFNNGVSLFATKPSIPIGQTIVVATPDVTAVAQYDEITYGVLVTGAASDLTISGEYLS